VVSLLASRQEASKQPGRGFRSGSALVGLAPYTVTADGQRFLLHTLAEESSPGPVTVVVNCTESLKKKLISLDRGTTRDHASGCRFPISSKVSGFAAEPTETRPSPESACSLT
jgi:hypothetical protein